MLVLLAVTVLSTNAQCAVDWADLTNGLAGSTITFPSSQGITGRFVLLVSFEDLFEFVCCRLFISLLRVRKRQCSSSMRASA